jgi:hypothetical protein
MNVQGIYSGLVSTHPEVSPDVIESDVLHAYDKARKEFTQKWDRKARSLILGSAGLGLATLLAGASQNPAIIIVQTLPMAGIAAGYGMRYGSRYLANRDSKRQLHDGHPAPDAPDTRFGIRTQELLQRYTLH